MGRGEDGEGDSQAAANSEWRMISIPFAVSDCAVR